MMPKQSMRKAAEILGPPKSHAQRCLEGQFGCLAFNAPEEHPRLIAKMIGELHEAIERDSTEDRKKWHGPFVVAYGWTPPDQTGQFEVEFHGGTYYVVETEEGER